VARRLTRGTCSSVSSSMQLCAGLIPPLTTMQALQYEPTSHIVAGGALATLSGAKTGRTCVAAVAVALSVCADVAALS
jgi:hypothetical protein